MRKKSQFEMEIEATCAQLTQLADGLANDGLLVASGVVLGGRQAIRALWTRLSPPLQLVGEPPTESPAEDVPTPGPESVPPAAPDPEPTQETPPAPEAPPLEAVG